MTAMERERLRIQTDLIGQENQHLVNTRDSGNVRQLRGHNIPIPTPLNLSDKSGPDSAGSFDPGIENKPLPPVEPPPLPPLPPPPPEETVGTAKGLSKTGQMKKPDIWLKPIASRM